MPNKPEAHGPGDAPDSASRSVSRSVSLSAFDGAAGSALVPDRNLDETHALAAELRVVTGRLMRQLREQAVIGDLSWSQIRVLLRLDKEGPATVSTLARAEGMRPQSMGETVSALRSAGFIKGAPDPNDGRQTVLSLTDACREAIRASRAKREDWLFEGIRTRLSPDEQTQLAHAVGLLRRLIDTP